MARQRQIVHHPAAAEPDDEVIRSLRPTSLEEYIGQTQIVESLRIAIQAARQRGGPLDHVLLFGPPGLGKTTLAHIIRKEMGTDLVLASGPALRRAGDLMGYLSGLKHGDIFFIDEIHRLDPSVEERLYSAMEDFRVDIALDRGANARMLQYPLKPFTLVGATTMAGLLSAPLRDRFGIYYNLQFYTPEELTLILHRSAQILAVPIEPEGAREIARRSRGTPRIANRLLRRVRDYAEVCGDGVITREIADRALALEGIDSAGLDPLDRRLLEVIVTSYGGGPVGIEALAATLNEQQRTLVEVVEPYLLKEGYLARTPLGRKATARAYEHLGLAPPPSAQHPRLDV